MNQHRQGFQKYYLGIVIIVTLAIFFALAVSTYYINFWPTDSMGVYIPTAKEIFERPYLSEMHDIPNDDLQSSIIYGKEALILGVAIFQRLLNDTESLYPNILLLIFSVSVSSWLVFLIFRKMFDDHIGLMAFLLFVSTFWPYLYVLQGAHTPLALMYFLIACFFLLRPKPFGVTYFLSGCFLGFMVFSSPTAPTYLFYYLALFIYSFPRRYSRRISWKEFLGYGPLVLMGMVTVFLLFTYPDPVKFIRGFLNFLRLSRQENNLIYQFEVLTMRSGIQPSQRGGGWIWILRYFLLIMPVMFPLYLGCLYYFVKRIRKKPLLVLIGLLSLSTPITVELLSVVQFGRTYFPWFIGIILVICSAFYFFRKEMGESVWMARRQTILAALGFFFVVHIVFNGWIFASDVFPSRMTTTDIYQWLSQRNIKKIATHEGHVFNYNVIDFFNNPKYPHEITFDLITTIRDVKDGYILALPFTGKSIWQNCFYDEVNMDPYLTELLYTDELKEYALVSFPALSSSRIWAQEEEVCTYRDLMLNQITKEDRRKGHIWILDAKKLHEKWFSRVMDP